MDYPNVIDISSKGRYRDVTTTLTQVDNDLYQFNSTYSFRIIGNQPNIEAVDPSGGPFITKGYALTNEFIVEDIIYNNNQVLIKIKRLPNGTETVL